jgi:MSHA biogenesis protein MshI
MFDSLPLRLQDWLRRNGVGQFAPPARVGVALGPRDLHLVRLVPQGGARPRIEFAEVLPCEPASRAAGLRRAAQAGAFRFASVHAVLAPGAYEVHQLPAPSVPEEELREAVRFQLRGALGYPVEEAVVDFVRIPQPSAAGARSTLLAVSTRASLIEDIARAFTAAGVELDSIDVPEFAQRNLGTLRAAAEGTQGWLAVDGEACLLTVQLGDELAFARHFTLPPLQMPKSEVVDLDAEAALPAWHERIGNQVARSLDLFERQSGLPPVLQMTVAPHGQAAAIARAIAAATGIDTDVFDPAAQFELMPGLDRERRPRAAPLADCMLALGAGLRSEAPPHPTASTASARVDADALPA